MDGDHEASEMADSTEHEQDKKPDNFRTVIPLLSVFGFFDHLRSTALLLGPIQIDKLRLAESDLCACWLTPRAGSIRSSGPLQ